MSDFDARGKNHVSTKIKSIDARWGMNVITKCTNKTLKDIYFNMFKSKIILSLCTRIFMWRAFFDLYLSADDCNTHLVSA